MEKPLKNKSVEADKLRALKHDIRNQLSNIHLAIDQLRYEIPDGATECIFYIDAIAMSCAALNTLIDENKP